VQTRTTRGIQKLLPKKKLLEPYCNYDKVNSPDKCPTEVYYDLRNIKDQLTTIQEEVDDALQQQPSQKVPKWDIRVRSKKEPVVKGPLKENF